MNDKDPMEELATSETPAASIGDPVSPEAANPASAPAEPRALDVGRKEDDGDGRPVAVRTEKLTKRYGNKTALESLDLEIRKGEIFGYIGPNGAGKTTTIRILSALLHPSSGHAEIHGVDVRRQPRSIKELVGYMPDAFGVYDNMSLQEYLEFFAAAYYIPRDRRKGVIDSVLELTDLGSKRDDAVSAFSRGMKQRACLAKTLLHNPQVLILDEPASGLDPRARIEFRELLRELQNMGKTIIVSSHILTELSTICTTVGIIEAGKLIASGDVRRILASLRTHRRFAITLLDSSNTPRLESLFASRQGVVDVEVTGGVVQVTLDATEEDIAALLEEIIRTGIRLTGFREELADLETAFMTLTKGELR